MNRRGSFWSLLGLLVAAVAAFLPTAPAMAQSSGSISGVVASGRAPVAGARVVLSDSTGPIARTQTDDRGAFQFASLAGGRYTIEASKEGVGSGSAAVGLREGQSVRVQISLVSRDPGSLTGVVHDGSAPVADAMVVIRNARSEVTRATTDANGRFAIRALPAGTYAVHAAKRGVGEGMARVEIVGGQTAAIRVQLRQTTPATGAVTGIVSLGDAPVAEAIVILSNERGEVARATTSADGRYAFRGVQPGTYALHAAKRGVGEGAGRVAVTAGQVAVTNITLRAVPQPATLNGFVVSAAGAVADANVTLLLNGVAVAHLVSGADGSFSFPNLRPGTYTVQAAKRGVGTGRAQVELASGSTVSIRVRLQ